MNNVSGFSPRTLPEISQDNTSFVAQTNLSPCPPHSFEDARNLISSGRQSINVLKQILRDNPVASAIRFREGNRIEEAESALNQLEQDAAEASGYGRSHVPANSFSEAWNAVQDIGTSIREIQTGQPEDRRRGSDSGSC